MKCIVFLIALLAISYSHSLSVEFQQQPQAPLAPVPLKQTSIKGDGPVESLTISPDGQILAVFFSKYRSGVAGRPGELGILFLHDPKPLAFGLRASYLDAPLLSGSGIAITPDSRTLILGGGVKEKLFGKSKWIIPLLSLSDWQLQGQLEKDNKREERLAGEVRAIVVTPHGNYLAVGYGKYGWVASGKVDLWSLRDKKLLATFKGAHSSFINALAVAQDGRILISASRDKTIKLWSLPDGELLSTLQGHTKSVNTLAITPDSKFLASGSDDRTIKLWSLTDGKLIGSLEDHAKGINSIAIAPGGRKLFSGSADGTIKLWSLPDGKLLTTLQGHTKGVSALAITPDGKLLVSGDHAGLLIIWVLTGEFTS